MVKKGLASSVVLALVATACVDGTTTTAPSVQPNASVSVQGSCRVTDNVAAKERTLSGNCSNSTVNLPVGWSVRFDTDRAPAPSNYTSSGVQAFLPIANPVAPYLNQTTKIDISSIPDFTLLTSISDGTLTANFSTQMDKRTVGFTWLSWSSPPFSEDPAPHILFSAVDSITVTLSQGVQAFGFELEPNAFNVFTYQVGFYNARRVLLGTISQTVDGNGGARLFAAHTTSPTSKIRGVIINSVPVGGGSQGFAIGQVRYAQ